MIKTTNPDALAVAAAGTTYSYSQLLALISSYARRYAGQGATKVAITGDNSVDWIAALYSCWANDCVAVPIDAGATADDMAYILSDCRPELIFAAPAQEAKAREAIAKSGHACRVEPLEHAPGESEPRAGDPLPRTAGAPDATALIIYTSGTTGDPKGVMLSFRNLKANIDAVSLDVEIFRHDRQTLILLPLHHIFPLAGSLLAPLHVGASVALSPSMQPADLLATLRDNQVGIIIGVPRLYELLHGSLRAKIDATAAGRAMYRVARALKWRRLSRAVFGAVHRGFGGHIAFLVSGGAALPKHIGEFFRTLGFEVLEGYGMTEASPMITFTRPGRVKVGSPGHPLPRMRVEIRDGEIVTQGDNIMQGYYNRPGETSQVIRGGWLHTGDLGHFDKRGFLHITGRLKELIILSNGKNVNPSLLDAKFEGMFEEVREAAVFQRGGHMQVALVADRDALRRLGVADFDAHIKESILPRYNQAVASYYRVMKGVAVDGELPRTKLGKIQRFRLEQLADAPKAAAKSDADFVPGEDYLMVKQFLETQVQMQVEPGHHIEMDLALDSLGKLSLIDFIEKSFGIKLDETRLLTFPSVREMSEYIREKRQWIRQETINWADALREDVKAKLPKAWPTLTAGKAMARGFFRVFFRYSGTGVQNIPEGPCIIAPNHQSFLDGLFVASFLKRRAMRQTYFYAKKKHVNTPMLRLLARTNNVIVMDLESGLKESIQKMAAVLKQGKKVIIFPEGTRTKTGKLGEFKKTFAMLSAYLDVPVVPVAINGAGQALPVGSKIPHYHARVTVDFLKPVYPRGNTPEYMLRKVSRAIEKKLASDNRR